MNKPAHLTKSSDAFQLGSPFGKSICQLQLQVSFPAGLKAGNLAQPSTPGARAGAAEPIKATGPEEAQAFCQGGGYEVLLFGVQTSESLSRDLGNAAGGHLVKSGVLAALLSE